MLALGVAHRFGLGWHASGKVSTRCVTVGLHPVPACIENTWYAEGAHVFTFMCVSEDEWLHAARSNEGHGHKHRHAMRRRATGRAMQSAKPLGCPEASVPPDKAKATAATG